MSTRQGTIETVKRATVTLDEYEIRALLEGLSYYNSSAHNNFGAGYQPGNEVDQELMRDHQAVRALQQVIEAIDNEMSAE